MSKKGIPKQSLKMAMCLIGSKNYYDWIRFQPRYFISTAKHAGYSEKDAKNSLEYLFDNIDKVIEKVESMIPKNFPEETISKIFTGMKETKSSNPLNRIK
jgi:serine/threonine-protein kinase HipA